MVGLITADFEIDTLAPIVITVPELLRRFLGGPDAAFGHTISCVVLDEFHFIQDGSRGGEWEKILLLLPANVCVVALSATVEEPGRIASWMNQQRKACSQKYSEMKLIQPAYFTRPVPLRYSRLISEDKMKSINPVILWSHPQAGSFTSEDVVCLREAIAEANKIAASKETTPLPLERMLTVDEYKIITKAHPAESLSKDAFQKSLLERGMSSIQIANVVLKAHAVIGSQSVKWLWDVLGAQGLQSHPRFLKQITSHIVNFLKSLAVGKKVIKEIRHGCQLLLSRTSTPAASTSAKTPRRPVKADPVTATLPPSEPLRVEAVLRQFDALEADKKQAVLFTLRKSVDIPSRVPFQKVFKEIKGRDMLPAIFFVLAREQADRECKALDLENILPPEGPERLALHDALEHYKNTESMERVALEAEYQRAFLGGVGIHHSGMCTFLPLPHSRNFHLIPCS